MVRPPHTGTYQCHVNDPDRQGELFLTVKLTSLDQDEAN